MGDKVFKVSELVRKIALKRGKAARQPKVSLARIESGEADKDPLIQSYAELEDAISSKLKDEIESLKRDNEILTNKLNDKERIVRFYKEILVKIDRRAKGSFFGKGGDISALVHSAMSSTD